MRLGLSEDKNMSSRKSARCFIVMVLRLNSSTQIRLCLISRLGQLGTPYG